MRLILLTTSLLFLINTSFAQWENVGSGITTVPRTIGGISVVDSNTVWGITWNPNEFVQTFEFTKTEDGGVSWQSGTIDIDSSWYILQIFALNADTVWIAVTDEESPIISGRIFKTTDGGENWLEQSSAYAGENETPVAVHFFDANQGFTYGASGKGNTKDLISIYTTDDGGENWGKVTGESMPELLTGEGIWIYGGNGMYEVVDDHIWFVTNKNRVFHSSDRGHTWTVNSAGTTNQFGLTSVAFQDTLNGLVVTFGPAQAARTTDGGMTWEPISIFPNPPAAALEYVPGTESTYIIYDATWGSRSPYLQVTFDHGENWKSTSYGTNIDCMVFLSPGTAWGGGIVSGANTAALYQWIGDPFPEATTTSTNELLTDLQVRLSPNPASEEVNVVAEFETIPKEVVLTITDVQGKVLTSRKVRLANDLQENFNVEQWPGGVYFLQLRTNQGNVTQQFTKQ